MSRLSKEQIEFNISKIPGWRLVGHSIERSFVFNSFKEAISFVNQLSDFAEEMNHHPDISIRSNQVVLLLSTHEFNGLTGKDFALAQRINKLVPAKGKVV